jgi:predicted anti-sigma-YlaC factor YlaD
MGTWVAFTAWPLATGAATSSRLAAASKSDCPKLELDPATRTAVEFVEHKGQFSQRRSRKLYILYSRYIVVTVATALIAIAAIGSL